MKCEYQYKCRFVNRDSLCMEVSELCHLRNKYQAQKEERERYNEELRRLHTHNDVGLVERIR